MRMYKTFLTFIIGCCYSVAPLQAETALDKLTGMVEDQLMLSQSQNISPSSLTTTVQFFATGRLHEKPISKKLAQTTFKGGLRKSPATKLETRWMKLLVLSLGWLGHRGWDQVILQGLTSSATYFQISQTLLPHEKQSGPKHVKSLLRLYHKAKQNEQLDIAAVRSELKLLALNRPHIANRQLVQQNSKPDRVKALPTNIFAALAPLLDQQSIARFSAVSRQTAAISITMFTASRTARIVGYIPEPGSLDPQKRLDILMVDTEFHLDDLVHLPSLPNLKVLVFKNCQELKDSDLQHLHKLPQLEHLVLQNATGITGDGFQWLPNSLQSLRVENGRQLQDHPLRHLSKQYLWKVAFTGCYNITNAGVTFLEKTTSLRYVSFESLKNVPFSKITSSSGNQMASQRWRYRGLTEILRARDLDCAELFLYPTNKSTN